MIRYLLILAILSFTGVAHSQRHATLPAQGSNDLASQVAGTYRGDVISDARGSSRSGVTVTIIRVGPNEVEVSADYSRLPTVRIRITQALDAIVQSGNDHVFLIERDKDPAALSLTIDDASLSLRRE